MQAYKKFQWQPGVWVKAPGTGELCSDGWLHYYSHPLLAVLFNPIHADINNPKLWTIETSGKLKSDNGVKFGASKLRLVQEIEMPKINMTQRVAFGILCSFKTNCSTDYGIWAKYWLNGVMRSGFATTITGLRGTAVESAINAAKYAEYIDYEQHSIYAANAAATAAAIAAEEYSKTTGKRLDLVGIAQTAMAIK